MMRIAELHLERYGHFEDRRLTFPAGSPDFHIIHGLNEAGKSTALAAISDLLFGFDTRSPYNFRFDYPLLRVGAVLEEDDARFVCRRRKTRDDSLIDAEDRRLDEGRLAALLHGLNRDTFSSGFSLDQEGLRRGGEAMIHASDDIGKALFAAGSGLTGIAEVQSALERELDAIWGKRASERRTFSAAAKRLEIHLDTLRKAQIKPKEWTDARTKVEERERALQALRRRQRELAVKRAEAERMRRVGPAIRERTALVAEIAEAGEVVAFSQNEEAVALDALNALAAAARDRMAAERRRDDVAERSRGMESDSILDFGARVESLTERRGAITKADVDLNRLEIERKGMEQRVTVLRDELALAGSPPTLLEARKLRDITNRHAGLVNGMRTRERDLEDHRACAQALREELSDAPLAEGLDALRTAIAAARGLGDDFDERCALARDAVEQADVDARTALAALVPWRGDVEALSSLPVIGDDEIQVAADAETQLSTRMEDARAVARRLGDEIQTLDARRAELARTGKAVSEEEIAQVRRDRDERWRVIDAHLRGRSMEAPAVFGEVYAGMVEAADDVADRRYAAAEDSARLTVLNHERALKVVEEDQARRSVELAEEAVASARRAWEDGLRARDLPPLTPLSLRTWLSQRRIALERHAAAIEARQTMIRRLDRRMEALAELKMAAASPPETDRLSPMLNAVERERLAGEALVGNFLEKRNRLSGLEDEIERQERLDSHDRRALEAVVAEWAAEKARPAISLDVDSVAGWLELVEELRGTLEKIDAHDRRMRGIVADRTAFETDVADLAGEIGAEVVADRAGTVETLRVRLNTAREVARDIAALTDEWKKHQAEVNRADVDTGIAMEKLRPHLARAGIEDPERLQPLLERSKTHRERVNRLTETERRIVTEGDHVPLLDLLAAWEARDPDGVVSDAAALEQSLDVLNGEVAEAADAFGEARKELDTLDKSPRTAADAAADAEAAKADMRAEADVYVLKRAQFLMLRWAMERYRERHETPLLKRAGALFGALTLGRFVELKVDYDAATPRLLGVRNNGETLVSIEGMSEGTRDQLFLALRLAAVERSLAAGVRVPFLADDLFVNFDDERSLAGLRILNELSNKTQVLFFTHHANLRNIGVSVFGISGVDLIY